MRNTSAWMVCNKERYLPAGADLRTVNLGMADLFAALAVQS